MDDPFRSLQRGTFVGADPYQTIHQIDMGSGNVQPYEWYGAHAYSSSVGQTNVLSDPTFELLPYGAGVILGTVKTAVGTIWSGHYVLNSGVAPTQAYMKRYSERNTYGNLTNSALMQFQINFGTSASDVDIYFYPSSDFSPTDSVLDYLVAGVRNISGSGFPGTWTTANAYMELYNATDSILVSSDPLDLTTFAPFSNVPLVAYTMQSVAFFQAKAWRFRLRVHLVKPGTAGVQTGVAWWAEPQLGFNFSPETLPFAPLVGQWYPPNIPQVATITAAGTGITPSYPTRILAFNLSGNLTTTAAPTIADGAPGQEIILLNTDTLYTWTIKDQGTLASSNLRLNAATIAIAPRQSIRLLFDTTINDWVQIGPLVAVI